MLSAAGCGGADETPSLAVASAQDPASALIAHIYAEALRFYGSPAHVEQSPDPLTKLDTGEARVVPGFTGRLLHRFYPDSTARSATQVYREMVSALPEGVAAGDYTTSAQDKPALAVTEATADAWGGRDLTAATRNCDKLVLGRVAGAPTPDVPSVLGTCKPPKPREYPDRAALFAAVRAGEVNAAWTSTAAPNIPTELLVLSDRTSLIRAENLVPLYRRNELNEAQVLALNEVAGVLDTAALAEMRAQVSDGTDPGLVAGAFLAEHPLGD
ncbi:glycine betaine ABC transporter substrate-binding protein [Mycolicibacterium tusciae]|uniref:glycine betaine ABC transporter substrate-binding protein n=1 Tax=Mycolicibacterium tusciae TaxID=75922 RepID=UPI001EF84921|nr:glycine betaine ABC transporter substrate-binding protein [Mycolicibacterium tusciae]